MHALINRRAGPLLPAGGVRRPSRAPLATGLPRAVHRFRFDHSPRHASYRSLLGQGAAKPHGSAGRAPSAAQTDRVQKADRAFAAWRIAVRRPGSTGRRSGLVADPIADPAALTADPADPLAAGQIAVRIVAGQ